MSAEGTVWSLEYCRAEYRKLARALQSEQYEHQQTATELVAARYTIELQKDKLAQMEQELAAAHHRALVLSQELAECKRMGEAGTRYATVTPLRPKPKPENDA